MATYTLEIPDYLPVTLNKLLRAHWKVRSKAQKECDALVAAYARQAGIPVAGTRRRVSLVFRSPRTPADCDARLKLLFDALTHTGMVQDDSPTFLELGSVNSEMGPKRTVVILEDI